MRTTLFMTQRYNYNYNEDEYNLYLNTHTFIDNIKVI